MNEDNDSFQEKESSGEEWKIIEFQSLPQCTQGLVTDYLRIQVGARWEIEKGLKFEFQAWLHALLTYNPALINDLVPRLARKDLKPFLEMLLQLEPPLVESIVRAEPTGLTTYTAAESTAFLRKDIKARWPKLRFHIKRDLSTNVFFVQQADAPTYEQLQELAANYMWSDDPLPILGNFYEPPAEEPGPGAIADFLGQLINKHDAGEIDLETDDLKHLRFDPDRPRPKPQNQKPTHRLHVGPKGEQSWVQHGLRGLDVFVVDANGNCLLQNGEPNTVYRLPKLVLDALFKGKK